jgi:hypothetical protein
LNWARVADGDAGGETPLPRPWLADTAPAGFARPPITQRGLGRGLSIVGGSLTPPASRTRGTARPEARQGRPAPRIPVGGPARFPRRDAGNRRRVGALIEWCGEGRATNSSGDGHSIDWFGDGRAVRGVGGAR